MELIIVRTVVITMFVYQAINIIVKATLDDDSYTLVTTGLVGILAVWTADKLRKLHKKIH